MNEERRGLREVFNFGDCEMDLSGIYELAESYEAVTRTLPFFLSDFMQKQGNKLLAETKKRTPVGEYFNDVMFWARKSLFEFGAPLQVVELPGAGEGLKGGTLRRSWRCSDVKQTGQDFEVTVFSQLHYAPYVEYGHRTVGFNTHGNIVGWWEGRHMALNSLEHVKEGFNRSFQAQFLRYLYGLGIGTD